MWVVLSTPDSRSITIVNRQSLSSLIAPKPADRPLDPDTASVRARMTLAWQRQTASFSRLILGTRQITFLSEWPHNIVGFLKPKDGALFSGREITHSVLKAVRSSNSNLKSANRTWGFIRNSVMDSIGMQRLKAMFDDDSAVSPVIGVILMVAITVILAAVIASFVLGLGDQGEPAPQPTMETSVDAAENNITLDVTGGDDFDAGVATIQGEVDGSSFEAELDGSGADEITAGDSIVINTSSSSPGPRIDLNGNDLGASSIGSGQVSNGWEVEIIWNPSDQDSSVIYSDSS